MRLRGGYETTDPRLGRVPQFDERSRSYGVREDPRFSPVPRSKTWALGLRLDQGNTSACTGFSRSHDLAASPKPAKAITDASAQHLYDLARKYDEWAGENYEGSSVLGAAKAALAEGYIGEYRWAFGIDDVIGALGSLGGVVFGTSWLQGMFDPRPDGTLDVSGASAGGHAYFARGVAVPRSGRASTTGFRSIKTDVPLIRIANSWGKSWGVGGDCLVRADDMESLLKKQGECAVTTAAFVK